MKNTINIEITDKGFVYSGSTEDIEKLIQKFQEEWNEENLKIEYTRGQPIKVSSGMYKEGYGPKFIIIDNQ